MLTCSHGDGGSAQTGWLKELGLILLKTMPGIEMSGRDPLVHLKYYCLLKRAWERTKAGRWIFLDKCSPQRLPGSEEDKITNELNLPIQRRTVPYQEDKLLLPSPPPSYWQSCFDWIPKLIYAWTWFHLEIQFHFLGLD